MAEQLEYENIYESIEKDPERATALWAISNALIELGESLTLAGVPEEAVTRACRAVGKIVHNTI